VSCVLGAPLQFCRRASAGGRSGSFRGKGESKILTMIDVCRSGGKGSFIFSGLQEWGMAEGLPSKPQSQRGAGASTLSLGHGRPPEPSQASSALCCPSAARAALQVDSKSLSLAKRIATVEEL
jgi:hypothetical protein